MIEHKDNSFRTNLGDFIAKYDISLSQMASILQLVAIMNFQVANVFSQNSNLQRVFLPILVIVATFIVMKYSIFCPTRRLVPEVTARLVSAAVIIRLTLLQFRPGKPTAVDDHSMQRGQH